MAIRTRIMVRPPAGSPRSSSNMPAIRRLHGGEEHDH